MASGGWGKEGVQDGRLADRGKAHERDNEVFVASCGVELEEVGEELLRT